MLYGEINRQRLKIINEHVVADTIDYLEAQFAFSEDWDGLEKWVHFAKDGEVYDIRMTDDCIRKEDHLNLSAGIWKVYLHGNEFSNGKVIERITTSAAILKVEPTGALNGEPFPEMPASVTEQILARLENVEQNGGGSGGGSGGGITKETDPTVPDWAKQPKKPTYTADEVGAATAQQVADLSKAITEQGKTIPKVFDWANAELPFTEAQISDTISGSGFVVNPTNFADGKTYFRYHAGTSYGFLWTNPNQQKGAVTLTVLSWKQWDKNSTGNSSSLNILYSDGTTDNFKLLNGVISTFTTNANKVLSQIKGNYDIENWILLDMDVLSIVADYPAPTGTVKTVNGVEPDENGNVEIAIPEGGGGTSVEIDSTLTQAGKAADAKVVGDKLGEVSKAIADKADKAGWTPDKYIGTDAEGNLIEKDAPAGGGSGTVTSVNGNAPDENGNVTVEVGQPTDEQIATAVEGWLDEHPEATTTVADGSITREKMAFPAYEGALSPNLADPSAYSIARFTSTSGKIQTFSETSAYVDYWRMTDYIDVSDHIGEQLWATNWQGYCFYDANKTAISESGQFISNISIELSKYSTAPITIPEDAEYIVLAFCYAKGTVDLMLNFGDALLPYVQYGDINLPDASVGDAQINGKLSLDKVDTDDLLFPTIGKNLVDKSQMIKHKWLNADGTVKDTAESLGNWHVNGIKVKPNTNYLVFGGVIVFFDVYGNVCGSDGGEIFTYRSIVSPVGAATCGLNGSGCNETDRYLTYPSHMIHGEFIVEGDTLPDRVLPGKYYEKAVLEDNILHDSVLYRMRDCWNPSTKTTIGLCGDSNTRGIMGNGDTTQNPNCWANLLTAEIEKKCSGERYIYPFGDIGVWGTNVYSYYEASLNNGVIRVPFYGTSIKLEFGTVSAEITADVSIDDAEAVKTTIPADGYTWEGLTEGYHTITLVFSANPTSTLSRFVVNKTVEVVNRGIVGRNLNSLHHDLGITGDTIDLICFGTNNRGNGDVHADTRDLTMFEFRNKATNLIYMSPIPAWDSIEEANEPWKTIPYIESFIAGREARHNREYISLYHEIKDYCTMNNVELTSLYVEGLHLNDEGHKVVAKILCRKLGLGDLSE